MEHLEVTRTQRLSYAIYAIALVCTLSLERSRVSANPLTVAQQHWETIVSENPELLATRYSDHAVLQYSYRVADLDEVYQGQSIYSAWQKFFWQYQIKNFQVVKQQQRD